VTKRKWCLARKEACREPAFRQYRRADYGSRLGHGFGDSQSLRRRRAAVALTDIRQDAVIAAAEELVAEGRKAIGIRCNVADESDVAAMVERTVSTFGRLDAAFNNAGVRLWKWPMPTAMNSSA
jgi:NAD(P)-dependent dehydrogenase (short-subunit alcohol dehydrogenase family)